MDVMKKPFVFGVAVGDEHFIGREQEQARLGANMSYGVNTILISPRRIGKTSLVKRVARNIATDTLRVIHLDIFSCRSEYDFYNAFASAVLRQTASRIDEWREHAQEFISRLAPKLSFSPEPLADFSLSLGITPKTHKPEEILNLPEQIAKRHGWHIVVCVDEFQQIGEFPDTITVQKRMRTVWQHQENVSYCLYGSKKHMMSSLFQQSSKPFYKFGSTIYLGVIPAETWVPYLCQRFSEAGKCLKEDVATYICEKVSCHSSYVQELAYATLICSGAEVCREDVDNAFQTLMDDNTLLFVERTQNLTTYQMNFLRAILDDIHDGFGLSRIRNDYQLGSASNIARIKASLLERELIDVTEKGIFISDPVLLHWLNRILR